MKRKGIASLLLCGLFGWQAVAQSATGIVDKAAAAYEKANGISATFALHTRMEGQGAESFEGQIQMKSDKFTLVTPDMHIWYDGKTQWVYVERNEEVNVTTPTGAELQSTNPIVLLRTYKKDYNATLKGESTADSGKTAYDIELTPKKKGEFTRVELQIEKLSGMPSRITVQMKNGTTTTIRISRLQTGLNQADSFFAFNPKEYPDAEVIDLR